MDKWLQAKPGPPIAVETFICEHCRREVSAAAPGARLRSHCPHCLWSAQPPGHATGTGEPCRGRMEPIAVHVPAGGAWSLVHRCGDCGGKTVQPIAADDDGALLLTLGAGSKTGVVRGAGRRAAAIEQEVR